MRLSFARTGIIEAPAPAVWEVFTTFAQWPVWGPSTRAVVASSDRVAVGVTGKVQTPVGIWLPFEITEVVEGQNWTWRVASLISTTHTVEAIDATHTRVGFSLPVLFAPYALVCDRAIGNISKIAGSR